MMPADSPDAGPSGPAVPLGSPAGAADTGQVQQGVDVSDWQHPGGTAIAWSAVAAQGATFAFVKATEAGYTNSWLAADVTYAAGAGLAVGAYDFARPEYPAAAQADAFAAALRPLPRLSLPPVLDLEESGGLSAGNLIAWTHTFIMRLEADTGVLPMIYSGPGFWAGWMGGTTAFATYPLWEAHYTSASAPAPMGGWAGYRFWQFTSSGAVGGIPGAVDLDRFTGSQAGLTAQAPSDPITLKHDQLGGDTGLLGPATGSTTPIAGGYVQTFRYGAIYSSPFGAHEAHGAVLGDYLALAGPAGPAGFPTSDEMGTPDGVGRYNLFANASSIYWSPTSGAHEIGGAIRSAWAASGWEAGVDGYPTTDELPSADGTGRYNQFSNGTSIYWSPGTGAHEVGGAIRGEWAATGWETGPLGYPVTDETGTPDGVGRFNQFSNAASIYWSPTTGPHAVNGAIRAVWAASGWEAGVAGYPTSDDYATAVGRSQNFQHAVLVWNSAAGTVTILPN